MEQLGQIAMAAATMLGRAETAPRMPGALGGAPRGTLSFPPARILTLLYKV